MYYSLIDDLAFLMNSLPPYNGSASFASTSLVCNSRLSVYAGRRAAAFLRPGSSLPCTIFAPQGIQPNAKTPAVQEWNLAVEQQLSHNTSLRVAYVGSFAVHELLSIDPNTHSRRRFVLARRDAPPAATAARKGHRPARR